MKKPTSCILKDTKRSPFFLFEANAETLAKVTCTSCAPPFGLQLYFSLTTRLIQSCTFCWWKKILPGFQYMYNRIKKNSSCYIHTRWAQKSDIKMGLCTIPIIKWHIYGIFKSFQTKLCGYTIYGTGVWKDQIIHVMSDSWARIWGKLADHLIPWVFERSFEKNLWCRGHVNQHPKKGSETTTWILDPWVVVWLDIFAWGWKISANQTIPWQVYLDDP